MKRSLFLVGVIFLVGLNASSQDTTLNKQVAYHRIHQAVSLGINCPLGEFANTHLFGFGVGYYWSPKLKQGTKNGQPAPIRILLESSLDYFLGKTDNYNYKNKGYSIFQGMTGVLFQPGYRSFYSFTAGAALDRYGSKTAIGLGTHLNGSFYVKNRIAVSPGLRFIKFKEADGLWMANVGACYIF